MRQACLGNCTVLYRIKKRQWFEWYREEVLIEKQVPCQVEPPRSQAQEWLLFWRRRKHYSTGRSRGRFFVQWLQVKKGHGLRMVYSQRGDTLGTLQRRTVKSLESHLKNRVLGSRYLLNCSAVQTKFSNTVSWCIWRPFIWWKEISGVLGWALWVTLCLPTRKALGLGEDGVTESQADG